MVSIELQGRLRRRRTPRSARASRLRTILAMLLLATTPVQARAHAIHSTLTEITLARDGTLTVRIRTFADDFSLAVSRFARMTPRTDHVVPDEAAARYVLASFTIARDGQPLSLGFVSQQRTGDVVWIELRARTTSLARTTVRNAMLFDVHSDQVNVVKTTANASTFTTLFSAGDKPKLLRI
jgi:hypothetical protein